MKVQLRWWQLGVFLLWSFGMIVIGVWVGYEEIILWWFPYALGFSIAICFWDLLAVLFDKLDKKFYKKKKQEPKQ